MPGNRRVFVSHAHADNDRCLPLLAAMDAWGADYWFDTQELNPGQQLTDRIQKALTERDIFVRVCTPAAMQSYWMGQEVLAYRGLQEQDRGRAETRKIVYLILDQGYVREPTADSDIVIDAATRPQSVWMGALRKALEVAKIARSMNRRAFLGLGIAGVATVASVGTAAAVLVRGSGLQSAAAAVVPTAHQPTVTPLAGQQRLLWTFTTGGSQPSVALGTSALYANTNEGLYALDLRTGNRLWLNTSIQADAIDNRPLLLGDTLYSVGSLAGGMAAVKAIDGSPVWSTPFSPLIPSAPATDGTALYVYADDGNVTAFDRGTGAQLWQTRIASSPLTPLGLAVSSGFVFGVSDDQNLYALRTSDGSVANKVSTNSHTASPPIATSDTVYFLSGDGNVYALNAADQASRWKTSIGLDFLEVAGAPVLADGTLYVCTGDGYVVSLDAASGTLHWSARQKFSSDASSGGTFSVANTPALDAAALYVPVQHSDISTNATYSFLLAVSRSDGHELWRFGVPSVGYQGFTSPVVGNGAVYFGGIEHTVYAVSTAGA